MESINKLTTFISAAEKSRKYPSGTAASLKTSIKLIESYLNDEEKNDVTKILSNVEQIFHTYYQKNQTTVAAGSLATYQSRVKKVIKDYLAYGTDPSKMANWNPVLRIRKLTEKDNLKKNSTNAQVQNPEEDLINESEQSQTVKIKLENGVAIIKVPNTMTENDVKRLKAQIDLLGNI